MNIAQVHIKVGRLDESLEYLSRVLYLDLKHVKALSRKAFVYVEKGDLTAALPLAKQALSIEENNAELLLQVDEIQAAINCLDEEERVRKMLVS